jgi:hypothetical protein
MIQHPLEHRQFKASFDSSGRTITLSFLANGSEVALIHVDVNDAAIIAGIVLGAAQRAHRASGRPDKTVDEDQIVIVTPTGLNVGSGRKPDNLIAAFYFGDSALGLELAMGNARILGQRLLTSAAEGTAQ